ncbi:hydrophobin [Xylogone sp. PMI_703]|nr:hydrophobin [Xylogone sp. PMI_703]
MKFFTVAAIFVGAAMAVPTTPPAAGWTACQTGNQNSPVCCAVDVLKVADLDCEPTPQIPTSPDDFQKQCQTVGKEARCCTLALLGQGIGCDDPAGIN